MKLKWGDFVIFFMIAAAIVVMLLLSVPNNEDGTRIAQIIKDGKIIHEVNLDEIVYEKEYLMDDGDVIIVANNGEIRFLESDCPNQICVHTGWISSTNQISTCIPNRILVKIVGDVSEVDAVVR